MTRKNEVRINKKQKYLITHHMDQAFNLSYDKKSGGAGCIFAVSCRAWSVVLRTVYCHNVRNKAFNKNILLLGLKIFD